MPTFSGHLEASLTFPSQRQVQVPVLPSPVSWADPLPSRGLSFLIYKLHTPRHSLVLPMQCESNYQAGHSLRGPGQSLCPVDHLRTNCRTCTAGQSVGGGQEEAIYCRALSAYVPGLSESVFRDLSPFATGPSAGSSPRFAGRHTACFLLHTCFPGSTWVQDWWEHPEAWVLLSGCVVSGWK